MAVGSRRKVGVERDSTNTNLKIGSDDDEERTKIRTRETQTCSYIPTPMCAPFLSTLHSIIQFCCNPICASVLSTPLLFYIFSFRLQHCVPSSFQSLPLYTLALSSTVYSNTFHLLHCIFSFFLPYSIVHSCSFQSTLLCTLALTTLFHCIL